MDRPASPGFSERDFYLSEFRGRTLAVALPGEAGERLAPVRRVVDALAAGGARAVVLAEDGAALGHALPGRVVAAETPRVEAEVWRRLREHRAAGVALGRDGAFAGRCREMVRRLGVFKLVWLDEGGGLRRRDGRRESFVDLEALRGLLAHGGAGLVGPERIPLWREVTALLEEGVPAVNVCSAAGLEDELFTYAGSGTLFTRERYMQVRELGVDDFDAAWDLIRRGVEEGYLAPRGPEDVDAVLAAGFGAFVESRHLAGIGALLPGADGRSAEIASLYTLTRFLGEGVGGARVAVAIERAPAPGMAYVDACTTQERVGAFFERHGLVRVPPEAVPEGKWADYDPSRRARVACYRRDLADDAGR
jgi:N-acetylglutamate synthase-like GNAT family acetyltransferase